MTTITKYTVFAATYDCNAYGAGPFGDGTDCISSTETGASSNPLADTGSPYFIALAGGIMLIVVASAVFITLAIRNRKAKNQN